MKLHALAPTLLTLATALLTSGLTGCASGTRTAQGPNDMLLQAADAELSSAIAGTTTLTSATLPAMPLPESRMPVSHAAKPKDTTPPVQTWGAPAEIDPELSEYGF